jgi:hypothetical protein
VFKHQGEIQQRRTGHPKRHDPAILQQGGSASERAFRAVVGLASDALSSHRRGTVPATARNRV